VAYAGGVALNAVANARLLDRGVIDQLYIEPAAADNGIALGCAFYGWMKILGRERVPHDGNTCSAASTRRTTSARRWPGRHRDG
jgi:carbamoyltransferase